VLPRSGDRQGCTGSAGRLEAGCGAGNALVPCAGHLQGSVRTRNYRAVLPGISIEWCVHRTGPTRFRANQPDRWVLPRPCGQRQRPMRGGNCSGS